MTVFVIVVLVILMPCLFRLRSIITFPGLNYNVYKIKIQLTPALMLNCVTGEDLTSKCSTSLQNNRRGMVKLLMASKQKQKTHPPRGNRGV